MLKYALLGLLHYQPLSGYEMEQFINTTNTHFWHAQLSQIYRTLKIMESEGLVTSRMEAQEQARSKRVYTLTEAGEAAFQEELNSYQTELDINKVPFLVRVFFFGDVGRERAATQLQLWRDLHQRQLDHYREAMPDRMAEQLERLNLDDETHRFFWEATLRFGVMYEEMVLRWFDEIMRELER